MKPASGLCCANGKVKLIPLLTPLEPFYSLVLRIGTDSIHFLKNIQQYNDCFQMTSFGATKVVRENFIPTCKVCNNICSCIFINHNYYSLYIYFSNAFFPFTNTKSNIYHRAGSLLPVPDSEYKFLQIYFMGNSHQDMNLRCAHNSSVKRSIVEQLQNLFHEHNQLIILFKSAMDMNDAI